MLDTSKIAILTTVANFDLYHRNSKLFPKGITKYVIDGTNGMHGIHSIYYMFKRLSKAPIDWLILADEDLVFVDANRIFNLIETMASNAISVCGVRDGGVVKHRTYNPHVINTFFTVLNFKEILQIYDEKEVKRHQYITEGEFDLKTDLLAYDYDEMSLYEPYYCFFLWLLRKGKKLYYLDSKMHDDITNVGFFEGDPLFYHTWYARAYNINEKHTKRINAVLAICDDRKSLDDEENSTDGYKLFKDRFFAKRQKLLKLQRRLINRLRV